MDAHRDENSDHAGDDLTSVVLHEAIAGNEDSLNEVIRRFTPYLLFQAQRLCASGRADLVEPEDLVALTWATVLPRLSELEERDGRLSPVIMRFLATSLLHLYNNARRRSLRRRVTSPGSNALQDVPDSTRGIISRALIRERSSNLLDEMRALPAADQEIILLVGLQQVSPEEVEASLGIKWESARRRYTRALARLRERLAVSMSELP